MGSTLGANKSAATKTGLNLADYASKRACGLKYCTSCKNWLEEVKYGKDSSRPDGLAAACLACRKTRFHQTYVKKGRKSKKGSRFVPVRDGDKLQARARVNHLIGIGLIPNPNSLPCEQCAHVGDDRRHEYHHFCGYGADSQEKVKSLCSQCHHLNHKK